MKSTLTLLVVLLDIAIAGAADKPTVYNHITGESTELDSLVKAALAPRFTVVDIRDSADYVRPKIKTGRLPRVARTETGTALGGQVLVAYVINEEGRVTKPIVIKTTEMRLNAIARKAMNEWRFEPGTLKGVAIATTAAQEFNFETAPTEFVTQILEPLGGKISRPKDWFYAEGHHGPRYMWTLSREDTSGGKSYTTGVRIQTFTGIKKAEGKSARQFILDFAAAKKKEADKVINTCDASNQGLFTRTCLETEEGPYHILYSLFWGSDDLDIAVVTIAGTTKELWETYSPAFDKMGAFELIDMKRFEK
jgi:TonB family protein